LTPVRTTPEGVIRTYLDEHGGEVDATVGHLLTTFGADAADASARTRIIQALASMNVLLDRPIAHLGAEEPIRLIVAEVDD
jgi:hypothetical protein